MKPKGKTTKFSQREEVCIKNKFFIHTSGSGQHTQILPFNKLTKKSKKNPQTHLRNIKLAKSKFKLPKQIYRFQNPKLSNRIFSRCPRLPWILFRNPLNLIQNNNIPSNPQIQKVKTINTINFCSQHTNSLFSLS